MDKEIKGTTQHTRGNIDLLSSNEMSGATNGKGIEMHLNTNFPPQYYRTHLLFRVMIAIDRRILENRNEGNAVAQSAQRTTAFSN